MGRKHLFQCSQFLSPLVSPLPSPDRDFLYQRAKHVVKNQIPCYVPFSRVTISCIRKSCLNSMHHSHKSHTTLSGCPTGYFWFEGFHAASHKQGALWSCTHHNPQDECVLAFLDSQPSLPGTPHSYFLILLMTVFAHTRASQYFACAIIIWVRRSWTQVYP